MLDYIKAAPDTGSISINFASNVILDAEGLKEKLSSISYMDDREVYELVKEYYETHNTNTFEEKDILIEDDKIKEIGKKIFRRLIYFSEVYISIDTSNVYYKPK